MADTGTPSTRARDARRWTPWIWAFCLLWSTAASALSRDGTIADLRRTTWGAKEGAPSSIAAVAQTSDGYLWIGSASGLFRFDGLRFVRVDLPRDDRLSSVQVWSLFAPASGGLWIGFTFGGVAFLKDGKMTAYAERDGLPPGSVKAFALDPGGTLWAGTTSGLARLDGSQWQKVGAERGYSDTQTNALLVDSAGTLWSASRNKTLFMPSGETLFREAARLSGGGDGMWIAESPDGDVWLANDDRLRRLAKNKNPGRQASASGLFLLFDRDGSLWSIQQDLRVRRMAHPEGLAQDVSWSEANGASVAYPDEGPSAGQGVSRTLIEDREGNVWVTSKAGLTRFSERNVTRPLEGVLAQFNATTTALAADDGGTMWIAGRDFAAFSVRDGHAVSHDELGFVSCAILADNGTLWFGGKTGLWKLASGRFDRIALPEGTDGFEVQAMVQDRAGDLWVSIVRKGVFLLKDGGWKPYGDIASLPRLTAVTLASDATGRIWFGYTEGRVAVLDGSTVTVFADKSQLPVGNVTAIYAKRSLVWVGGELGLAKLDGATFRAVNSDVGNALSSVTGIVETADGDLWVNSRAGVVHFTTEQTRRMTQDANDRAHGEIFDARDGVEGSPARLRPLPSAIEGTDGRLWFLTDADLYAIDPARIHRNPLPPPVVIESLIVGDRTYLPAPDLTLAKGTTSVRINYVGLSLTMAEKVRYRYQLDGVDQGWQDVQGRREAFYTNLSPGMHRFHVIAANNDGVWNETGTTLDFVIPPTFVQTGWFVALCAVGALLFFWLVIRFRVRQVAARMRGRFAERMAERERIARELHDTLLQSTQGLILRFQAVANQIAPDDPKREMLDDALKRADAVMAEGRDRVLDLRVAADPQRDLTEAFAATGEELAQGREVTFRCIVDGAPRKLQRMIRDEVYLIGREALLNAFRHAQAASIEVQIIYADAELRLRVRDDGIGVDADAFHTGSRPDHWGLQGMRERAKRIGAQLDLWSRPGAGTEIELKIPAGLAYEAPPRPKRWLAPWHSRSGATRKLT
jgi:signal transduction histidine kinase/ligand-binding sensor domain-containing protein